MTIRLQILRERLAALMAKRHMSALALNRAAHLPRGRVESIKAGHEPKRETVEAIARVFGVKPEWLFGEDEESKGKIETYRTGGGLHWVVSEHAKAYMTNVPGALVGYQVDGDSMEPLARHGQIVLALRDTQPANGDLAVIEFESGECTFKRVYFADHTVILAPVNTAHEPEVRKVREIVRMMKVWGVKF